MRGDLREITVLNQYIGVHIPAVLPQSQWLPQVLLAAAALGIGASVLPRSIRRPALGLVSIALAGAVAVAVLQARQQMHDIGHKRDAHTKLARVHDFTPPFLGTTKIAQFTVSSGLGPGAYLIGAAFALQLSAAALSRRGSEKTNKPIARRAVTTAKISERTRVKVNRIFLISGLVFLAAIFVVGIYIVPKLQAGNSATARQSDAARVSLSDVFVDVTYATPQFVKRVKLEPYVAQYQNRAQAFLIGINTHVGTIADLDLRGKVLRGR